MVFVPIRLVQMHFLSVVVLVIYDELEKNVKKRGI